VVLAHNYQVPWIQDVADYVGDSLALSREAAETDAETIVFCGVHFMAETAKILSPSKTVLLPSLDAGCSLAASITAEQLRTWKAEHPGATVVAYVNTSADVKAESDICCTSSNAVDVVRSIPEDREILFLPDMFLGAHVERETGRKMELWMGECHVHAGIDPAGLKRRAEDPDTEILIHPECGCTTTALWLLSEGELPADRTKVLSTGGMVSEAERSGARRFLVATETGILHQLRRVSPTKVFEPVDEYAVCRFMKAITPENLVVSLREGIHEIQVPSEIAHRARRAVERMIEIGPTAGSTRLPVGTPSE
jgi:quinolinate synthase